MKIFGPADFPVQPWKNGGGITRELRRAPHPLDPTRFAWRISSATVAASGPFSLFPGIDRTLMLLEGDGLALRSGQAREVKLTEEGQTVQFSGDLATQARLLGGPVRDFNLMTARNLFRGELSLLRPDSAASSQTCAPLCLLYMLKGTIALSTKGNAQDIVLAEGDLGQIQNDREIELRPVGPGCLVIKTNLYAVT